MTKISLILLSLLMCGPALAGYGEQSFTPTSVVIPIYRITIGSTDSVSGPADYHFYTCSSTTMESCLVDLANAAQVAALVSGSPYPVPRGTYDKLTVQYCAGGAGFFARVQGQTDVDESEVLNRRYYLKTVSSAGADPLTLDSAQSGPVQVSYTGCASSVTLPQPLVVGLTGATLPLKLHIALRDIAWMKLGPQTLPSGCIENTAQIQSFCMAYPSVIATVASEPLHFVQGLVSTSVDPLTQKSSPATAGAQLIVLTSLPADGSPQTIYGGFTRHYFSKGSRYVPYGFDTPFKSIQALTNPACVTGCFGIENYGSSETGPGYLKIEPLLMVSGTLYLKTLTGVTPPDYTDVNAHVFWKWSRVFPAISVPTPALLRAVGVEPTKVLAHTNQKMDSSVALNAADFSIPGLTVISVQTLAGYFGERPYLSWAIDPPVAGLGEVLRLSNAEQTLVITTSTQAPGAAYTVQWMSSSAVPLRGHVPVVLMNTVGATSALARFQPYGRLRVDGIYRPNVAFYLERNNKIAQYLIPAGGTVYSIEENGYPPGSYNGTYYNSVIHDGPLSNYQGWQLLSKFYYYPAPDPITGEVINQPVQPLIPYSVGSAITATNEYIAYPAYNAPDPPVSAHYLMVLQRWDGASVCPAPYMEAGFQSAMQGWLNAQSPPAIEDEWDPDPLNRKLCYCNVVDSTARLGCAEP
jgi:hypothetical protein